MDKIAFGERMKSLRTLYGITEKEMSEYVGCSMQFIEKIERGEHLPTLGIAVSICNRLGVTVGEFFDYECIDPVMIRNIKNDVAKLSDTQQEALLTIIGGMVSNNT